MGNAVTNRDTGSNSAQGPLHRFMTIDMELAPDVLVPRAETELLGRKAVEKITGLVDPLVIDMCCGAGNLALAIAAECRTARVWGADLTDSTVALARRNTERLGLADRVTIRQGDLFGALAADGLAGKVDVVVCNPPYISTGRLETESAHLLQSEPREAFDGGPYGISIHQRLVKEVLPFLKEDGWLLFEFGLGQDRQALALLNRAKTYADIALVNDAEGNPRVAMARRIAAPAANAAA